MVRLKTLLLAAMPAVAVIALAPAPVAAAQPSQTLAQVQAHFRAVESMTANFAQTDRRGQTLTGTLTLKRPGRLRFEYQKGVPLLVVGDNKAIHVIDSQVKRVQRVPIVNSPLSVLLNARPDLSRIARVVRDDAASIVISARDPQRPEFGTITVAFAKGRGPSGLTLQAWTVLDSQNNQTIVRLSNQRFNVPVPDSAFRWTDPRTGRVIG
jgi:outer membrane lipoprotein-sorting protein